MTKKSDGVRVFNEKKSDGVRINHEKERWSKTVRAYHNKERCG